MSPLFSREDNSIKVSKIIELIYNYHLFWQVIDISEIKFIKDLNMLRDLNLLRNPIQELPDYRLLVLYRLPKLKDLDRKKVEVKEKVSTH